MLIRTLLTWLLVLAIPAQGAAAATMAFCGPYHHSGEVSILMEAAGPADHTHHDGAAVSEHEHPSTAAVAVEDTSGAAVSAVSAEVSDASKHELKHKCSACSSCCSVGAILSSVLAVPAPVFTPTVFSAVVPSVDTLAADGPDRPPRIGRA